MARSASEILYPGAVPPQDKTSDIEARRNKTYHHHQDASRKAEGLSCVEGKEPAKYMVSYARLMWSLHPQYGSAVLLDADLRLPDRTDVERDELDAALIRWKFN